MFKIFQDLLYRRARALVDYENSNKALDKARLKGKDVAQAEEHQRQCLQKFDKLSESAKKGLSIILLHIDSFCAFFLYRNHKTFDFLLYNRCRTHQLQGQTSCCLQEKSHRNG